MFSGTSQVMLMLSPATVLEDDAAALVDLTDDRALELRGSLDLDLHDRLEDGRRRVRVGLAEAHERGGLERHFGRVDRVRMRRR